ncbi:hypothetical protein CMI37_28295 [Candidatus Pacearchaeota archaeon]|nr:hypothetical protein [Candidatus Pacearchaeota archaeon]
MDSYINIESIGALGAEAADTAFLFSSSLPTKFFLRGIQVFNSNIYAGTNQIYLDIYDGEYNGGSGTGSRIWRFPSSPLINHVSTIIPKHSYTQVDNGLYYEWSAASSAGSHVTIFYT